jgi:effector-binding domain-containing protein
MPKNWISHAAAGLLAILAALGSASLCLAGDAAAPPLSAQSAPAPAASPSAPVAAPQTPGASSPTPPSGASETATPAESNKPKAEGSTGETVDLAQRPFAYIEGKADRDEVYGAIQGSLGLVKRDMDKSGLTPSGRPIAVFIESDDTGFRYRAGYPLASAPDGKTTLSDAVKIGTTPSGKAMRFQHLGAYADIDATYDAITAYLDEKGIDAQDSFVEEYANDVKDVDDPNLEVDIYVLLK